MAAPTCVITSVKRFKYRTDTNEEWSNRYMFTGPTPADSAAWRALFDALNLAEKPILSTQVSIIRAYGYDKVPAKGDSAVWSVDLRVTPNTPVVGTGGGSGAPGSGDTAQWIRWGMDRMVHGKRIYVRKYYHPAYTAGTPGNEDALPAAALTPLLAFATKMDDGSFISGRKITDAQGSAVVNHGVSTWATTRTLKKRPKRPPT